MFSITVAYADKLLEIMGIELPVRPFLLLVFFCPSPDHFCRNSPAHSEGPMTTTHSKPLFLAQIQNAYTEVPRPLPLP